MKESKVKVKEIMKRRRKPKLRLTSNQPQAQRAPVVQPVVAETNSVTHESAEHSLISMLGRFGIYVEHVTNDVHETNDTKDTNPPWYLYKMNGYQAYNDDCYY